MDEAMRLASLPPPPLSSEEVVESNDRLNLLWNSEYFSKSS